MERAVCPIGTLCLVLRRECKRSPNTRIKRLLWVLVVFPENEHR